MKMMCSAVILVGVLNAAPVPAGEFGNGQGYTNIWSSAQRTSNSYGHATASSGSAANSVASGGGGLQGTVGAVGGVTSTTSSIAQARSNGSGYAQAQTSGYAGGNATGAGARGHWTGLKRPRGLRRGYLTAQAHYEKHALAGIPAMSISDQSTSGDSYIDGVPSRFLVT
jgi:hypothetical protein